MSSIHGRQNTIAHLFEDDNTVLKNEIEKAKAKLEKHQHRENQNSINGAQSITDWSNSYLKFKDYEDEDELKKHIEILESKLKKRLNLTSKAQSFCCSKNRGEERRVANLSLESRLDEMRLYRDEGSRCYRSNNYEAALKLFEKSLLFAEYCFPQSIEEKKMVQDEKEICLLNSAACYFDQHEFQKCISCCREVLDMTPGNSVKAFYRLSQCYRKMLIFDKGNEYIQKAKSLLKDDSDPLVALIQQEEVLLKKAIVEYRRDSKKMAKRMISFKKK